MAQTTFDFKFLCYTLFCVAAKVIDFRKAEISLVDICMEETGGVGVDCIVDNGGIKLIYINVKLYPL